MSAQQIVSQHVRRAGTGLRFGDGVRLPSEFPVNMRADREALVATVQNARNLGANHRDAIGIVQHLALEAGIDADVQGFAENLWVGLWGYNFSRMRLERRVPPPHRSRPAPYSIRR